MKNGVDSAPEDRNVIVRLLIGLLAACICIAIIIWYFLLVYSSAFYKLFLTSMLVFFLLTSVLAAVSLSGIYIVTQGSGNTEFFRNIALRMLNILYMPVMAIGSLIGTEKSSIQKAYANLNNKLVCATSYSLKPEEILLLLPHCLQNNECAYRLTNSIHNCRGCGKCNIKDIIELLDRYPVKTAVVPGGTMARKKLEELNPKAVVAVACERDLASGIHDAGTFVPVLGVFNQRPNGPCFNTKVDVTKIEDAIKFLSGQEV